MDRSIKGIINISLMVCIISVSIFPLVSSIVASATTASSYVQFSNSSGTYDAGPIPVNIQVDRLGNSSGERIKVILEVLNSTLPDDKYYFDPTVMSWDLGDTSSKYLIVTVPLSDNTWGRQTITFGLLKVEGNSDVGEISTYRMAIDFPLNESAPTVVPSPTVTEMPNATLNTSGPALAANITANGSVNASASPSGMNITHLPRSNAQNMPLVMLGGLVSLAVVVAAGYLLIFKRK